MSVLVNAPPRGIDGDSHGDLAWVFQTGPGEHGLAEPVRLVSQPQGPDQRYSVESYTRAVRPLTGLMVTVARRILGDEVQAWDAVQEALIGLWNEGEIPPNPRAWLTRAVVLRSLHLARSRSRRRWHERRACERRPEASDRDDPTKGMEYEELERTLDETLRTIPPEYRDVILLRTAARMDYAAIADALHIPIGTVRSRLNRTRQIFRRALSQRVLPEDDLGGMVFIDH
jgi:RNA polymerase sigma-70 factor (ECF subfamily)